MEKEVFKKEFQEALKNPKKYFQIRKEVNEQSGRKELVCDIDKLNDFFQSFSKYCLDQDIAGLADKFPTVKFEDFEMNKKDKFAVGNQNARTGQISLNLGMFLKAGGDPRVFLGFVATLCHEHHHFRQNLYVQLKEHGREVDAEKLADMFSSNSGKESMPTVEEIESKVANPLTDISFKANNVFLREVMPEKYNQIKSPNALKNILATAAGKNPLEVAYYFHDAHEVDAREQSVEIFKNKFKELVDSDSKIAKKANVVVWGLEKFNKTVLNIQPKKLLKDFEDLKAQIGAEEFILLGKKIDLDAQRHGVDASALQDKGLLSFDGTKKYEELHEVFKFVLNEKLSTFSEIETKKFLDILKSSDSPYVQSVVEKIMKSPTVEKVDSGLISEERREMDSSEKLSQEVNIHKEKTAGQVESELIDGEMQP